MWNQRWFSHHCKVCFVTFDVRTIKMSKGWRKSIGCLTLETIVCACKVLMIDALDGVVIAVCALGKVVVKEFLFAHNQG